MSVLALSVYERVLGGRVLDVPELVSILAECLA